MTKEQEALEIFRFMLKSGEGTIDYWDGTIAELRTAIETAINALERQSGDCVSMSELKNILIKLETKCKKYGIDSIYNEALWDFTDELRAVLPAQKPLGEDATEAFRILCQTLKVKIVESPKFVGDEGKILLVNEDGKVIDDRGELYLALYHLATKICPNTEFRHNFENPNKLMCELYEEKDLAQEYGD